MSKLRIGLFGAGRGIALAQQCQADGNAELVAVCDKFTATFDDLKAKVDTSNITFYSSFDEFIKHDMDAVFLANYATEHAPFAVRCLDAGKHVMSELLPCQTMKQAVELVEAVERSGKIYAYAENCCFMKGPSEMTRLFREGKIGEFEYADCEYIHDLTPDAYIHTYGEATHWRNTMYATFYCTHSLGPIIHATGLRPVSVSGFELPYRPKMAATAMRGGLAGIEMVTLENGAIIKSVHGNLPHYSLWYAMYGSKGTMETARYISQNNNVDRIFTAFDEAESMENDHPESYVPVNTEFEEQMKKAGHSGADFITVHNFIDKLRGLDADIIDVYEALDMYLPGMFAYRSVLNGNQPMAIPNLRNPEDREKYRNDTTCVDPNVAGDMVIPSYSKGNPDIPEEFHARMKEKYRIFREEKTRKAEEEAAKKAAEENK